MSSSFGKLLLFDVDGTICESGKKITQQMVNTINQLVKNNIQIGIVGGGTYEKIIYQLDNKICPDYIFSECGSVFHKFSKDSQKYNLIKINNLRSEPEYVKINHLVKTCLKFISELDCLISGHFVDLRNGLIYVSLVGMVGTDEEREKFITEDNLHQHRNNLIRILKNQAVDLGIDEYLDICNGGSVGIAIYPKKWNKIQVLNLLNDYADNVEMHYFGDKYLPDGNDYEILNSKYVIPHCVDNPDQTMNILRTFFDKL